MSGTNLEEKIIAMPLFELPNHHGKIWESLDPIDQKEIKKLLTKMMIQQLSRDVKESCND